MPKTNLSILFAPSVLIIYFSLSSPNPCHAQIIIPSTQSTIDVSIDVDQIKWSLDSYYVPSNTLLNISAKHDPAYNNGSIYQWSTKEGLIKDHANSKSIRYLFKNSDESNFIKVNINNTRTNSSGEAKLEFRLKEPVSVADPVGKLFLEYGELLNITINYSGSPPFSYCYKFCSVYSILPCDICFPYHETDKKSLQIVQYLHNVGNYTLMFDISNIMRQETKHYTIKINDTIRKSNFPIAPIVCSILAVCILITGVALHMKFRDTSYATETANFDFVRVDDEEEWEQEFSFIQRVRYLIFREDPDELTEETQYLFGPTRKAPYYSDNNRINSNRQNNNLSNGLRENPLDNSTN